MNYNQEFKNIGQFEKIAWSVPVDFEGKAYLIEHRKSGLGIFAPDTVEGEADAAEIAKRIKKAVRLAEPFFEHVANRAAAGSKLNLRNRGAELFERFAYFLRLYQAEIALNDAERAEYDELRKQPGLFFTLPSRLTSVNRKQTARWLAFATIDAFFSWTEHIFVHLAVLLGNASTGEEVAKLAGADWAEKYRAVFNLTDGESKRLYDDLTTVRRQFRNFVAHGAFGKQGEAFQFHSGAGAVPLLLPHRSDRSAFRFGQGLDFVEADAISLLNEFVDHVWLPPRSPAKRILNDSSLPLILTDAANGSLGKAMASEADMDDYANHMEEMWDRSVNMDF